MVTKLAYNDMHMKGFDSPKQESFAFQQWAAGNPQFWWVMEVFKIHGHAPGWEDHKRRPDGTFLKFPEAPSGASQPKPKEKTKSALKERLLVLATLFPVPMSEQAIEILEIANTLNEQE